MEEQEPEKRSPLRPLRSTGHHILCQLDGTATAVSWALAYLGCMRSLCHMPAVVLDIDGTLVLNPERRRPQCVLHFTALAKACRHNNISMFAVTARPNSKENRAGTERELEACGVRPVARLFMKPDKADYTAYKHRCRERIRAMGHTVLLSVGDQFADLSAEPPHSRIPDDRVLVGSLGDGGAMAIKLPSE